MEKPKPAVPPSDTITVRVPITFRRRGGRKVLITPEGSPTVSRARIDNVLVRAIARAFRWRKLIETGVHATIQETAVAEKVNASFVGRILRLTLLDPDIIEAILDGRQPPETTLGSLMKSSTSEWERQQSRSR